MINHDGGQKTIRLLMIDDNAHDVEIVRAMLAQYSRAKFELDALPSTDAAMTTLMETQYDLVLLDDNLPREDGLSFLQRLERAPGMPPVSMLTGNADERLAAEALRRGASDFFPKEAISSIVLARAIHQALEKFELDRQVEATESVIFSMAAAVEAKDAVNGEHLHRMTHYAGLLGQAMGLDDLDMRLLRYGAILHDIGKVGVSEAILCKAGPLDEDDWSEMRQHPVVGEKICARLRFARDVGPIIRHHHERWDGTGYTDALSGEGIPLLARTISVVDAYDAMTSHRPHRMALPEAEAMGRLIEGAGSQWDPQIVHQFVQVLRGNGALRQHGLAPSALPLP